MIDTLKRYQEVRRKIEEERNAIVERLRQIDMLLANVGRLSRRPESPSRRSGSRKVGIVPSDCEIL